MNIDLSSLYEKGIGLATEYGLKVIIAIVILIIGLKVIKTLTKLIGKALDKKGVDPSLKPFLQSLIGAILKVVLFVVVASQVGIETTSFIAILGAAGLAIGMALQGSLANFAGGVLILLFKPFKVGDKIQTEGHTGVVEGIQIFTTTLITPQNETIIIPNGPVANGSIINYTTRGYMRADMTIGISYDADIKKAKEVIEGVLKADSRIMKEPAPTVAVSGLADSSVNLAVLPYIDTADYWGVYFDVHEKVKYALDDAGIGIPYPQMDVHLNKVN